MTSAEYQQLVEFLGRQFTEVDRRFDEVDRRFIELRDDVLGQPGSAPGQKPPSSVKPRLASAPASDWPIVPESSSPPVPVSHTMPVPSRLPVQT